LSTPADDGEAFTPDAEAEQMLREAGVPEEQIIAARQQAADQADDAPANAGPVVWAWHADAARICQAMTRRWHVLAVPGGALVHRAWDMAALREVRTWLRIKPSPKLWDQLVIMEREALRVLNAG
jgi:hypothetical protein